MAKMTPEEKKEYYGKFNQIISSPEFKFDKKLGGADLDFVLDHFVNQKPLAECKSKLKQNFKIDDETAGKIIRRLKNMYDRIGK